LPSGDIRRRLRRQRVLRPEPIGGRLAGQHITGAPHEAREQSFGHWGYAPDEMGLKAVSDQLSALSLPESIFHPSFPRKRKTRITNWMPAFAGMTMFVWCVLAERCRWLSQLSLPIFHPSFPRQRESTITNWMPAFAGMTMLI
jgi:hypothetical protein